MAVTDLLDAVAEDVPAPADPVDDPAMRVYRYAIVGDLPVEAVEEIRRAHVLGNQMVEIERAHAENVAAVWAQVPELVALEQGVVDAEEDLAELLEQAAQFRQNARSTVVPAGLHAQTKKARGTLRRLREERRTEKDRALPALKPDMAKVGARRKDALKALYEPAVAGGLYWASFNEVRAKHETAVKQVSAKRKEGKPAELKFHWWDGTGTIAVQLQRKPRQPQRTPALIADQSSPWRNLCQLKPAHDPDEWEKLSTSERRARAATASLRFRVGSRDHKAIVEVRVKLHRPIPIDADIVHMRITRRRIADRYRSFVSFVVRLPQIPARTSGPVVCMHMGWRMLSDGAMRVAVVSGASPAPRALVERGIVRLHAGWAEVVIPARWSELNTRIASTRAQRDRNLDVLKAAVVEWLRLHPDVAVDESLSPGRDELEHVAKWRSPGRFAALASRWRDDPPADSEQIRGQLSAWRRQDWHLWTWEANERDKLFGRRKDAWRNVAAWLCSEAGSVVVDGWQIATMARTPMPEDVDDWQHRAARANRTFASPGELRAIVVHAATARGVAVSKSSERVSQTHLVCGRSFDLGERAEKIMLWCPSCQVAVDQDVNALDHLRAGNARDT